MKKLDTDNKNLEENSPVLDLDQLQEDALKQPVADVAPEFKKSLIKNEEISQIILHVAQTFQIEPAIALIAIHLLFLKGAASEGTPQSLSVDVAGRTISKRDLIYAYEKTTGNNFIRRLAESMAISIGKYAEANGLRGELAQRIEVNLRVAEEPPLTPKEAAWCSSFSQAIPNLTDFSGERVTKLLAEDYSRRFGGGKRTQPDKKKTEKALENKSTNKQRNKQNKKKKSTEGKKQN